MNSEGLWPTGNPADPDECGLLIGAGAQFTAHWALVHDLLGRAKKIGKPPVYLMKQ